MKKSLLIASFALLSCQTQFNPANCVVAPGCGADEICDPITETCQSAAALSLTSIEPRFAAQSESTRLTIRGTGFRTGITVHVGGFMATEVSMVSSTELTALAHSSEAYCGPVNVRLTNLDNKTVARADLFRYNSLAPAKFAMQVTSTSVQIPLGPDQIVVADLDGDKTEDVVYKSGGGNAVIVCPGNKTAALTCNISIPYAGMTQSFIRVHDVEHNGRLDILISTRGGTSGAGVLLQNPGTLSGTWTTMSFPLYTGVLDFVPVDRDPTNGGATDLFVAVPGKLVLVPFVIGSGTASGTPLAAESLRSFQFAQLNTATAAPEIIGIRASPTNIVTLEQSTAPAYTLKWTSSITASNARLGDINGDGKLDLVSSNDNGTQLNVSLGQGDGTFAEAKPITGSGATSGLFELADLGCNGGLGLVVVTGNSLSYLQGQTDGTFGAPVQLIGTQAQATALTVRDLTGDGRPELLYTTMSGGLSVAQNLSGP